MHIFTILCFASMKTPMIHVNRRKNFQNLKIAACFYENEKGTIIIQEENNKNRALTIET